MKGVVFNLLEQVVVRKYGEAVWDNLLDATGLSGSYTTLGSYPDEEIEKLVGAASAALNVPPADVLRWFGREAMPLLALQYPAFFAPHKNTRSFVMSVNSIIHPEVRKLYAGAGCPHFHFDEAPDGSLLMGYNSPRKLCALAHGFIEGAGDHYGQTMVVEQPTCMHRGDPNCVLSIHVQ
jgi:Haem-NO-binding